jgi:hypothetical protein
MPFVAILTLRLFSPESLICGIFHQYGNSDAYLTALSITRVMQYEEPVYV